MVPGSQYDDRAAKEDSQKNGRGGGGSAAQGDPESQTTGKLGW